MHLPEFVCPSSKLIFHFSQEQKSLYSVQVPEELCTLNSNTLVIARVPAPSSSIILLPDVNGL